MAIFLIWLIPIVWVFKMFLSVYPTPGLFVDSNVTELYFINLKTNEEPFLDVWLTKYSSLKFFFFIYNNIEVRKSVFVEIVFFQKYNQNYK